MAQAPIEKMLRRHAAGEAWTGELCVRIVPACGSGMPTTGRIPRLVQVTVSPAAANNGSAFAGISANTPFYNIALGLAMLLGRYALAVPVLAVAGSLASKKYIPPSEGTLPTHQALFVVLLAIMVVIVGALTFFPCLHLTFSLARPRFSVPNFRNIVCSLLSLVS